jgi:hypothetical protein
VGAIPLVVGQHAERTGSERWVVVDVRAATDNVADDLVV